jgi:hypothetical protein
MGDSVFDKERKIRNKEINRRLTTMFDQKLWLVDTKTGDKLLLLESYEGGWWFDDCDDFLHEWLVGRDLAAAHGTEPTALILKTEGVTD